MDTEQKKTDVEYIEANTSKKLTEELWTRIVDFTTNKNVGIIVPCSNRSSVKIYHSYTTGSLKHVFDEDHKFFAQLADKITETKLEDQMHFLPIATHLEGNEPVPKASIERDMANIRDHLVGKWKVIIFQLFSDDLHFFQKPRLLLYDTPFIHTQIHPESHLKQELQTNQGSYIEWMIYQLHCQQEDNIRCNIPVPPAQVPLSIYNYLRQYIDIHDFDKFIVKFSPSYNIRIFTPSEEALEFTTTQLGKFTCRKYTDVVGSAVDKIKVTSKKKLLATIKHTHVISFFESIGVPLTTMAHYYRFQYVNVQYGLAFKRSKAIERVKDKDKYFDMRLDSRGNYIEYHGPRGSRELSIAEFAEGGYCISSFMQQRNEASTLIRGETIHIDEENILPALKHILLGLRFFTSGGANELSL